MKPSKSLSKERLMELHKAKMMGKHFRNLDPAYHRPALIEPRNHKGVI